MGERRSFQTHAGAGGVEKPESTPCEDWYGLGDKRCPNTYAPTGDLITDIGLIKEQLAHYRSLANGRQIRSGWFIHFTQLLTKKESELKTITDAQEKQRLAEEEARQSLLDAINLAVEQKIRETAKPKKETVIITPPEIIENPLSYSPLIIAGVIAVVVILLLKRRRA